VPGIGKGREEHERNSGVVRPPFLQGLKHAIAVKFGHGDVAKNQIGADTRQLAERMLAIVGFYHIIACLDQFIPDVTPQLRFILDAKDHKALPVRRRRECHAGSFRRAMAVTEPEPEALLGSSIAIRTMPGSEFCNCTSPPCKRASALAI